ncbi:MAG: hypothetical protein AAF266_14300 [Planctomycetota bacterium]
MTSVAGFYGAWVSHQKQQPLRDEISRLQLRVDGMQVSDRTKLHAVVVPNSGHQRWSWRVFVPDRTPTEAVLYVDPPPPNRRQRTPIRLVLSPGFNTLVLSIVRSDHDASIWRYWLSLDGVGGVMEQCRPPSWLADRGRRGGISVVGEQRRYASVGPLVRAPTTCQPGETLGLLRCFREVGYDDTFTSLIELKIESRTVTRPTAVKPVTDLAPVR